MQRRQHEGRVGWHVCDGIWAIWVADVDLSLRRFRARHLHSRLSATPVAATAAVSRLACTPDPNAACMEIYAPCAAATV